jgi:hypothetical protein
VSDASTAREQLLARQVFIGGANRDFGEITLADARTRTDELREVAGFGPTMRVLPVVRAWRELTIAMERELAATVAELDTDCLVELAPRLGVVLPSGPMMR